MKKTKELILDTALALFNAHGLSQVTLRTIASQMGISQGNLNYHYKKREDVIEALYYQLVKNIDDSMLAHKNADSILDALFTISQSIMHHFYEYRFFLLDFVQIMRENKNIKVHYEALTVLREQQFTSLINELVAAGFMRKELLPNEYKNLYKRFQVLGDFWISSAATSKQPLTKKSIVVYSDVINQMLFPYLAEKGQAMYQAIIAG